MTEEKITKIILEGEKEYIEKMEEVKKAVQEVRMEIEQLNESMERNRKLLIDYDDEISISELQ